MSIVEWNSVSARALNGNGSSTNGAAPANGAVSSNGSSNGAASNGSAVNSSAINGARNHETNSRPMHRLAAVRRQQGISQRNIARRLNVDIAVARQQEEETTDLPLSVIYQWQQILDVPLEELLVDSESPLSPPVMERARMVKVMKTVAAIVEKANTPPMKRLVQMLCDQLLEIMPELADVAPWHTVGQRRTLEEYGRVVERQVPDDMFRRPR
jgi:transcriptional regulator with XRE-family HTH domain